MVVLDRGSRNSSWQGSSFMSVVSFSTMQMDGLFIELLCKAVSTSTTFVFIINVLPDRFLSATYPVSRNRCTKSVIIDAFGAVSPGYFC
ncbi:hypothetical protein TNCV_1522271 [Trichonephila clavipes]|nr:hypothetical protein TNCV_1522271 [Trichonephila clavipes]